MIWIVIFASNDVHTTTTPVECNFPWRGKTAHHALMMHGWSINWLHATLKSKFVKHALKIIERPLTPFFLEFALA